MIALFALTVVAAANVPVPASCDAQVNARLAGLIAEHTRKQTDNVMVCGTATAKSTTQHGGPHGDHQVISVSAPFPGGQNRLIEVVTNDGLDGKVTAAAGSKVLAYGQAFFAGTGRFAAGVHDVHCATHSGADNGWVVVNGTKYPQAVCAVSPRHRNARHR